MKKLYLLLILPLGFLSLLYTKGVQIRESAGQNIINDANNAFDSVEEILR